MDLSDVERIQAVEIQPGDTIVVTLPPHATPEQFNVFNEKVSALFEGHEVVVVTSGVDISVMRG